MDYKEKVIELLNSQELSKEQKRKLESIFPELAESEDERIRKIIKQSLKSYFEGKLSIGTNDTDYAECLAWLEKQGEQNLAFIEKGKWYVCIRTSYKPNGKDFIEGKTYYAKEDYKIIGECGEVDIATDNPEEFFRSATEEEINDIIKNFVNEQKPIDWSEEDESINQSIIDILTKQGFQTQVNWLKSLKDRVQPKQEWSEKNKNNKTMTAEECIKTMADTYAKQGKLTKRERKIYEHGLLDGIKFGKDDNWKPNKEQMIALDSAIHCYSGISPTNNREVYALEIMKEQLKKLKEE